MSTEKRRWIFEIERLKHENAHLKAMIARMIRKEEHGCIDASCSLCDPEQPEDSTWELKK